ncbi:MAG: porin family protein [Treponema sp.]|nr:porin family protein [Treponema sp.]
MIRYLWLIIFILSVFSLYAQSDEQLFTRRLIWHGDEHVYRYAVEVDRSDNGVFRRHLREFTTASFLSVSLPAGDYRFRVTPHDILDRPGEATRWVSFQVRAPVSQVGDTPEVPAEIDQFQEINIDDSLPADRDQRPDIKEQITESEEQSDSGISSRYNTIGISLGTSFIDPVIAITIHGSYAPFSFLSNLFFQLGMDIGFVSIYKDVKSYYSLHPFLIAGYYLPINNIIGIYAGAGIGFMFISHSFEYAKIDQYILTLNAAAGVNLWNMFNISYILKTDFTSINHLLSVGYVYKFKQ